MNKIAILDRDGVINQESRAYIKNPDEWLEIPGSIEAIAKLKHAGFIVAITTNQSGVGRGYFTEDTLTAIHNKMQDLLRSRHNCQIDSIYYCPHLPSANCNCRKPKTGMLEQLQQDFNCNLNNAIYFGDSYRDYQVARAMGCEFCLITGNYGDGVETLEQLQSDGKQDYTQFLDLASAVSALLNDTTKYGSNGE